MDVSGRILRTWVPAIHAGMTMISIFMLCGERKLMKHFVDRNHSSGQTDREMPKSRAALPA
jgi:hypothetical protein